jgi:hypothetical protein
MKSETKSNKQKIVIKRIRMKIKIKNKLGGIKKIVSAKKIQSTNKNKNNVRKLAKGKDMRNMNVTLTNEVQR